MTKPAKPKPPKFRGVLASPIRDDEDRDAGARERWEALRERYGLSLVDPNYWQNMALCLALECVPGFGDARRTGRPPLEPDKLVIFWLEIEALQREENPRVKVLPAVKRYIERKAKVGERPAQTHDTLRNRHARAKAKAQQFIAEMVKQGRYPTVDDAESNLIELYSKVHKKPAAH